jgi:hypothetical protein
MRIGQLVLKKSLLNPIDGQFVTSTRENIEWPDLNIPNLELYLGAKKSSSNPINVTFVLEISNYQEFERISSKSNQL